MCSFLRHNGEASIANQRQRQCRRTGAPLDRLTLRLAVLSPFVDRRHGTERALAELLERLAQNYGCEIHLYAQRVEGLRVSDSRSACGAQTGTIYWHKIPSIPGPHVLQFLGWILLNGSVRRWHRWTGRASWDLVLSPGINCLEPDVVIVHVLFHRLRELAREHDENQAALGGLLRKLHRRIYYALLVRLERKIYGDRSIRLAAVSKRTAHLLNEYFHRDDVSVIPNGVDARHFSPDRRLARRAEARHSRGLREEECVLLLVGNDWRIKGLPAVLEAVAALPDLPLRLLVAGTDSPQYFQAKAQQLGVAERCRWESGSGEILDFYAAADIYVSPSREDSFGLPVAEAMASGLPVITSSFAGVAEFVRDGENGFVLQQPRNAQALAAVIRRLQQDSELRQRIGRAAVEVVRTQDWNRNAEAAWKLLTTRVQGPKREQPVTASRS